MAEKKVIIGFEIGGQKEAEGFLANLGKAAATLKSTLAEPVAPAFDTSEFDKGLAELEAITKAFGTKLNAVETLGFGKALSQGFLKTKDDIVSVAQVLEQQLAATEPGAAFESISKNLQAAQKELDKFAKAEEKAAKEAEKAQKDAIKAQAQAQKDAINEALKQSGGFAKAFSDGTIKSLADIEYAFNQLKKTKPLDDKDFLDARAALKVFGSQYRELGSDSKKTIKDLNAGLGSITDRFIIFNEETKQATLNTEALQAAYNDLEPAINEVTDAVQELDLQFDNLSIEALESQIGDFSVTQIEKEIAGLKQKLDEVGEDGIGTEAWKELRAKIDIANQELEDKLATPFKNLSLQEIKIELDKASGKQVEKNIEDLQNQLKKLKPNTDAYNETLQKLKLVKGRLVEIEEETEVIKGLDISQGYIDFATKTAEGFNNATAAVGGFAGGIAEADEVTAQFEKVLQALAVVQSIQDGFKAYSETLKGANASALTLGGGLKLLKFALAATGIGAIVLVVATLVSQFGGLKKVLSVVADAASAAGDAFTALTESIKFDNVLERAKTFGKGLFDLLAAPVLAIKQLFEDIFSGKDIGDSFSNAVSTFANTAKSGVEKLGKSFEGIGSTLADAFNKGFDTRQALRENERQKKLIETANARRAANKTVLDAILQDETLSFEKQKELIKQARAAEQTSLAESLRNQKERIKLLTQLGKNLTDEQKDELKELTEATVQSEADLRALKINAAQEDRARLVELQDFRLAQLQATTDATIAAKERELTKGVELQTLAAEKEKEIINEIAAARVAVLEKEAENIKARGTLTKDEAERLKAIVVETSQIQLEASDRITESLTRRIDETKALAQAQAALGQEEIARQQLQLDGLNRLEELNQREREKAVEDARRNLNSIKAIQAAREENDKAIQEALDAQIAALQKQAALELQNIELQKQGLQIELDALNAKQASVGLTKEEQAQVELLNSQLQTLEETAGNVQLNLEVDTKNLEADAKQALKESGQTLKDDFKNIIADPLGASLKDALIKGLGITDDEAAQILEGAGAIQEQLLGLIDTVNQVRIQAIDEELAVIDEQKAQLDQELSDIQGKISETQANIEGLQGALAEAEGSRRDAILSQIEAQQKAVQDLTAAEAKNAKAKEAQEKRALALQDEKTAKEKQAGKISLAIDTAKAFAAGAIGIANAFQLPPPAGIISGLAAIATIIGAITSVLALAKFAKGGVVKANKGMLLDGYPSHAAGGVLINVGGKPAVEAEGGEIVLTKGVSSNPKLLKQASDINVQAGGVKLAAGGFVPAQYNKEAVEGAAAFGDPNAAKFAAMQKTIEAIAARPVVTDIRDVVKSLDRTKVQDSVAL